MSDKKEEHLDRYFEVDISSQGAKGHYAVVAATDTEAKALAATKWVLEHMSALTIDCMEVTPLTRETVKPK